MLCTRRRFTHFEPTQSLVLTPRAYCPWSAWGGGPSATPIELFLLHAHTTISIQWGKRFAWEKTLARPPPPKRHRRRCGACTARTPQSRGESTRNTGQGRLIS